MTPTAGKAAALRGLLESPQTEFLMEAHSGLSARIVQEAGFRGIWASSLAISAQCGVRDNNELSWTQVLSIVELMADVTTVPILLDGDTGYGDFNTMRRVVSRLERCGGAGVCIEDKLFPKANSFLQGERQPLADAEEFCGKIKAGKDSQTDPRFCIVARVEALIAGWGIDEALRRAESYRAAGADAILIHSKRTDADEILHFAREWDRRAPLLIVPTKYYGTPTEVFRRAGISVVVWANHMVRASAAAMQRAASLVQETESLVDVEGRIAPLDEIFRLQGADELLAAEKRYSKTAPPKPRGVILGASRGQGLEPVTVDRPKVMISVAGKPVLRRLVEQLNAEGLRDITVVAGYKSESIQVPGIRIVKSPDYERGGELTSLCAVADKLDSDTLILYGDLLFRGYILQELMSVSGELVAVVDSATPLGQSKLSDFAYCSAPDDRGLYRPAVELERVSEEREWQGRPPDGRWIGVLRVRDSACDRLRDVLTRMGRRADFNRLGMPDLLNALRKEGQSIRVLYVHGHWLDVNNLSDLDRANAFAQHELG